MLRTWVQQAEWEALPPAPGHWGGLGAVPLRFDPRDRTILEMPGVARALHLGPPRAVDLSSRIGGVYDQGQEGACVAYSTATLASLDETLANRPWIWLDAENLYRRNGGTGANGVDTRQVLADLVAQGVNRKDGQGVVRESSYLFVPKQAGLFQQTIMAALSVGKPCVLATLLPEQFGWTSSGNPTQGYHQMCVIGGDETWCEFLNTWGPNFGQGGRVRISWAYLDPTRWDVFAYTVEPVGGSPNPPPPPPPPVSTRGATGKLAGNGLGSVAVGQTLAVTAGTFTGTFAVEQIDGSPNPPPPPPPPPGEITIQAHVVSGAYLWAAAQVAGQFVPSVFSATVGAVALGQATSAPVAGGVRPATWNLPRGTARGTAVTVTTQIGTQTGRWSGTT